MRILNLINIDFEKKNITRKYDLMFKNHSTLKGLAELLFKNDGLHSIPLGNSNKKHWVNSRFYTNKVSQ